MNLREFRRAGHFPSLACAFLYFDVSFMIWVLIGPLANRIVTQLYPRGADEAVADYVTRTNPAKGLLVAVPLLGGAVLRLVLGVMTDRWGAKRTGLIGMAVTAIPLLLAWLWAESYLDLILVGGLLGVAGASFAAALPLASRWYPPKHQGLAMGIAGAGNSGTAVATLFAPVLAAWLGGWPGVFGLAIVPLAVTFLVFVAFAKDSPNQPPPKPLGGYVTVLRHADAWWFCLLYSVTFGGFVGLASFLNTFFKDQYFPDDAKTGETYAAVFTTLCVFAGSFLRPVGGYLADRLGGVRMLLMLYGGLAAMMLGMASLPPLPLALAFLFVGMGLLGMGNGSVFQLVPQRFGKEIGVVTGIVGAAGGVGGFFLPNLLGGLKGWTGTFGPGFAVFALAGLGCVGLLLALRGRWERTFLAGLSAPEPAATETTAAAEGGRPPNPAGKSS
jgi:NNP family nitrate/nitrite transporter-like MFS transporter